MKHPDLQMQAALIAMGSGAALFQEYAFQKKLGWHYNWNPDNCIKRYEPFARKLIWC